MYKFFIWTLYFKILEVYMKKKLSLQFYDPFLRSEFILYFSYRVKNVFLTTLDPTLILKKHFRSKSFRLFVWSSAHTWKNI
jgi:hypothetical protein